MLRSLVKSRLSLAVGQVVDAKKATAGRSREDGRYLAACLRDMFVSCSQDLVCRKRHSPPATWTAACQNFYTRRRPSAQLRGRIMVVNGKGGRWVGQATRPGIMSFLVRGQGSKGVSGTRTGRASGGSGPRQTSLLSCLMGRGRVTW